MACSISCPFTQPRGLQRSHRSDGVAEDDDRTLSATRARGDLRHGDPWAISTATAQTFLYFYTREQYYSCQEVRTGRGPLVRQPWRDIILQRQVDFGGIYSFLYCPKLDCTSRSKIGILGPVYLVPYKLTHLRRAWKVQECLHGRLSLSLSLASRASTHSRPDNAAAAGRRVAWSRPCQWLTEASRSLHVNAQSRWPDCSKLKSAAAPQPPRVMGDDGGSPVQHRCPGGRLSLAKRALRSISRDAKGQAELVLPLAGPRSSTWERGCVWFWDPTLVSGVRRHLPPTAAQRLPAGPRRVWFQGCRLWGHSGEALNAGSHSVPFSGSPSLPLLPPARPASGGFLCFSFERRWFVLHSVGGQPSFTHLSRRLTPSSSWCKE
jgi:hypothetical protein